MNNELNKNLEELSDGISALEVPVLSFEAKARVKSNILKQISLSKDESLMAYIRSTVADLSLSDISRAFIKERIFEIIEKTELKRFSWFGFLNFNKKLFSSALIAFMVFGMFAFVGVDTKVARAETFTRLESFEGDVVVYRDGKDLEVYAGMELQENDFISTDSLSSAVIEYFDDSVSRLSSDTDLVLKKLERDIDNLANTNVEVQIIDGQLWSKVLNLVSQKSSFVVVAEDVYAKANRAAFDVKVRDREVEVKVFNHAVDVESSNNYKEKLFSGYEAISNLNDTSLHVKEFELNDSDLEWAGQNLQRDKEYVAKVGEKALIDKMDSIDIKNSDDYSFDRSVRENALLMITFDDVKKRQIELDLAEQNFIAAEIKLDSSDLSKDELDKLMTVLTEFSNEVSGFYELINEVSLRDPEYAVELKKYVEEKLSSQQKALSLLLPNSPAYEAKEIVKDLDLLSVSDESELAVLKVENSFDKLAEVEELTEVGEIGLAVEHMSDYEDDLSDVKKIIEEHSSESQTELIGLVNEVETLKSNLETNLNEVEKAQTQIGDYGVEIYGEKPLSPFLNLK